MKNSFVLDGELLSFITKNENKMGIGLLRNTQTSKGQQYVNAVEVNFWGSQLDTLRGISIGSRLEIEGRLKTNEWEYQGKKMSKLQLNCTKCTVLERANSKDPADLADIPF